MGRGQVCVASFSLSWLHFSPHTHSWGFLYHLRLGPEGEGVV
jgi:hypothetical protein